MRYAMLGILLIYALPLAAQAGGGTLTLPDKAPFAKDASVPNSVRAECGLEKKVPELIRDAAHKKFDKVVLAPAVSAKTPGKAMGLTITHVLAPGGGPWSGPKSVTVTGTLWDNGKVAGNFRATRNTTRGGGTCGMLERDAKEIAEDITKWLDAPGKDSLLGDAKK
ncbi:MAG: hypothetical protein OEV31_06480 [Gammaproteobacteria bacterium]|nr:hypothetical protein [Gammaproteobacteria bacterium]